MEKDVSVPNRPTIPMALAVLIGLDDAKLRAWQLDALELTAKLCASVNDCRLCRFEIQCARLFDGRIDRTILN